EEQVKPADPPVAGDDEVRPGIGWRLAGRAGHPAHPTRGPMKLFGGGELAVSIIRMGRTDDTRDPRDFRRPSIYCAWLMEFGVRRKDFRSRRLSASIIRLAENLQQIAFQQ